MIILRNALGNERRGDFQTRRYTSTNLVITARAYNNTRDAAGRGFFFFIFHHCIAVPTALFLPAEH